MIVSGFAARLDDVEVQRGEFETAAGSELADRAAANLLPRRLVEQLRRLPGGAARLELALGQQYVHLAGVEVDADAIAGAQQREAAADRRLGRDVEDRRTARGARLPAVAHGRQGLDPSIQ